MIARVVVQQDDIELVRNHWRAVELRFAESVQQEVQATWVREVQGGVEELPTAAFGLAAGGVVPTLPNDPNGVKTIGRIFLIDLKLPADTLPSAFDDRVHVRFDHGYETLALRGLLHCVRSSALLDNWS